MSKPYIVNSNIAGTRKLSGVRRLVRPALGSLLAASVGLLATPAHADKIQQLKRFAASARVFDTTIDADATRLNAGRTISTGREATLNRLAEIRQTADGVNTSLKSEFQTAKTHGKEAMRYFRNKKATNAKKRATQAAGEGNTHVFPKSKNGINALPTTATQTRTYGNAGFAGNLGALLTGMASAERAVALGVDANALDHGHAAGVQVEEELEQVGVDLQRFGYAQAMSGTRVVTAAGRARLANATDHASQVLLTASGGNGGTLHSMAAGLH